MTPPIVPEKTECHVLLSHPSAARRMSISMATHVTSWIPAAAGKCCSWGRRRHSRLESDSRRNSGCLSAVREHGAASKHGFARKTEWQLAENANASDDQSSVKLVLVDDHRTASCGRTTSHGARATIDDKSLEVKLEVFNTGDEVFNFTSGCTPILAVADIRESAIRGFTASGTSTRRRVETRRRTKRRSW